MTTDREQGIQELKELYDFFIKKIEARERKLDAWEEDLQRREQMLAKELT